jgi:hypothetical protein
MIQVDIGGHTPFPTGSKQFFGNFCNLLFLAVFNFRGHFEALNDIFGKMGSNMELSREIWKGFDEEDNEENAVV